MPKATELLYLLFRHPNELRALAQYWVWTDNRELSDPKELASTGWDRESMRTCWAYLDMTSRSFAVVIKNLQGDLARIICLFYLTLRALDTIEDDMTIPVEVKQPLLRDFYKRLDEEGWNFTGNGPEKDRDVCVHFDVVIQELARIPKSCFEVIRDITKKTGKGMADFCDRVSPGRSFYVETIEEYDLYCHCVAGLVGEGLSRLFAATGKEQEWIADQLELSNSCGLFLQKTNITRDYREDVDDGRFFWPREIWGKFGFADIKELKEREKEQQAVFALNGMVLDALRHSVDSLDYLTMLKNQSVFNFVAIPQVMAIATLALCYGNPEVLQRNVKIRRGQTVQLMQKATNPRDVAYVFRDFGRRIHAKSLPQDPNYLKISVACGKIEQWCEHHYPSFISLVSGSKDGSASISPTAPGGDPRALIYQRRVVREQEKQRRDLAIRVGLDPAKMNNNQEEQAPWWLLAAMMGTTVLLFAITAGIAFLVIWWFDLM
ncbi:squalene synthase [Dacryopinax primogenitus]|uniref:Squalene synthase n=1 Tax=Dacryopinax primogenitus (strain DJM 731) TaxID=1858805 RepID=M5GCE7_DACPD|nr:squalene synthase [Dacryopinax primogenitus]EJU03842.1 squalene synthase [Dacryopinax primogenitus]